MIIIGRSSSRQGLPRRRMLGYSNLKIDFTGATAEAIIATVTIPANVMGLNGRLLIESLWSYTNNANIKTGRIRFGGLAGTAYMAAAPTTTAGQRVQTIITNRNAANSQVGGIANSAAVFVASSTSPIVSAVDTTAAVALVFTASLANGADTLSLEQYSVELILP